MPRQLTIVSRVIALSALLLLALFAPAAGQGSEPRTAVATFAGGCFWCVEADFDKVEGVISTTSGYTGGHMANPTYEQVSHGGTGHAEAVEIAYDPAKVSYSRLLDVFWHNIDPLVKDRQFCDHGDQYRSAIFYRGEEQRALAEASKAVVNDETFRTALARVETPVQYLDQPQFRAFWDKDAHKLADVVKKIGRVE